jgi:phage shock protein C
MILGVCRGIADHFNISALWPRIIVLALLFFTKFWLIVGLYILAALLMKAEPVQSDDGSHVHSRSMALRTLKRTFDRLDRRIRRMEDTVTTREYDWERRYRG